MKYAVIPAAGSGTRMKELGKQYAKTVLPYNGKPIIVHIVDGLLKSIEPDLITIVYSNEDHKEQIKNALSLYGFKDKIQFEQVFGGRQGPAKSILSGLSQFMTSDDEVYVHLSDFIVPNFEKLSIEKNSISAFKVDDPSRWCMVHSTLEGYVDHFSDKPKGEVDTNLAVSGLYYFGDGLELLNAFNRCDEESDKEFQISEVMAEYHEAVPLKVSYIDAKKFKDFGTIEEFIQNRGVSKSRSFNIIEFNDDMVTKSSYIYPDKINAEAAWFGSVPVELQKYVPKILQRSTGMYTMEKVKSTNLRDLYLYLDRSQETWYEILDSVYKFIKSCEKYKTDLFGAYRFWNRIFEKNNERILGAPYHKEASMFLQDLHYEISESSYFNENTVYHGDLHFANMFYCFHYKDLKLVDPNGHITGHWFYDLAKLNHSVNGKYDWIDAELYDKSGTFDRGTQGVKDSFNRLLNKLQLNAKEKNLLTKLTASLFLTMIPLHNHSKSNQYLFLQEFRRLRDELG